MKLSMYNMIYSRDRQDEGYVLYNSLSGALALMDKQEMDIYKKFQNDRNYKLSESLFRELKKGGFILADDIDEGMLVRHKSRRARYASNTLGLTIAPTSDCNFRCAYCFEKGVLRNTVMSKETQDGLVKFVESKLPEITHLSVSWYGGEPMLQMDIIENLSNQFIKMTEKHGVTYSSGIVTNGSLLTEENAKRLCKCRISTCQVTIDGGEVSHNQRRPFASGAGTYDIIMRNLSNVFSILPNIVVRVNLDKTNVDDYFEIKKFFTQNGMGKIRTYPAMVSSHNGCYDRTVCFDINEFLELEYEIIKSEGMQQSRFPVFRGNVCCADTIGGYVVDADGSLYKCWSDIGYKELSFGNVLTGVRKPMNQIVYVDREIDEDDKCKNCKLLPICLGGCPYQRRTGENNRCISTEEVLGKYLKDIVSQMKKMNCLA